MQRCTAGLHNFDGVTGTIVSGMNKNTCSSDPFTTRLLMCHDLRF